MLTTFTIELEGKFPYSMFRHDLCTPASKDDSNLIGHTEKRMIKLKSSSSTAPTIKRWELLGCKVLSINS